MCLQKADYKENSLLLLLQWVSDIYNAGHSSQTLNI